MNKQSKEAVWVTIKSENDFPKEKDTYIAEVETKEDGVRSIEVKYMSFHPESKWYPLNQNQKVIGYLSNETHIPEEDSEEVLRVGEDMICPVTKEHCDDETCTVGAECNVSGNDGSIYENIPPKHGFNTMKLIFLIIGLSIYHIGFSQLTKKDIPTYLCMFGAGMAYGEAEEITWHDPYSRSDYWNPYSGKRYPLNLNGYHLLRGLQDGFVVAAVVLSRNDLKGRNKALRIAGKVALCSLSFYMGQQITWRK